MSLPTAPSFRLDGRRALVTGASSGIGAACAAALAEQGAHVTCAARGAERLQTVVDQITARGDSASAMVLDIADLDALNAALQAEAPFDIVVNSAGLARHSAAVETTADDFDAVMSVNLRAAYFLSSAVARGMIGSGRGGSIIHISSQMGHVGGIDRAVYSASKHALEGMVKSMAIEWGPQQVRINTVCPTFIRTPLTEQTFANPERVKWLEEKIKLGRVGKVEDIMGAVVYLASDASALVTGTAMMIDGGWTAD
ncbi:SDR family NAD(P)-dependent oxidoreductase [Paracoccus tegillarcae]|uniref:3-oxoacyl-ACP reductase n=1 Tax=Paracoccus tegillarcae TaxID=1529068 RepID=A0A2K9F1K5_9RHOB|nr:SDR family oxidoreductase [Paracoccus tegillarcae]AUH34252.1 3-oxoacyl-ACP reductase [Paracoccus tegillarcae]